MHASEAEFPIGWLTFHGVDGYPCCWQSVAVGKPSVMAWCEHPDLFNRERTPCECDKPASFLPSVVIMYWDSQLLYGRTIGQSAEPDRTARICCG